MEPATNSNANVAKPKQKRNFKSHLIYGGIIALLIVAVVGAIFISLHSGVLYFGFKSPDQEVILRTSDQQFVIRTVVCGEDVIAKYNSIPFPMNEESQRELDEIVKNIQSTANNDKDPTCQAILWWNALQNNDQSEMEKTLEILKQLHSNGQFVDNSLTNTFSIRSMDSITNLAAFNSTSDANNSEENE